MIGPLFVLRMAWREGRAGRRRLWLLTSAITAGVAALVAINSFTANLEDSVNLQAQTLLGADLVITGRQNLPARAQSLVDSLRKPDPIHGYPPGRSARVVSFAGMAYVPRTSGVRLVQVRALEPGYPFYGSITTNPANLWRTLGQGGKVLVDANLLTGLRADVGDTLALGEARLVIAGTVTNFPGDVGVASAFGPRVFMAAADLPNTKLLRFGSRLDNEVFVKLPNPTDARRLSTIYRPVLRPEHANIRSIEDDRQNLADTLSRLGNYLGLSALVALLLGGLGVASAVHVFIKQKMDTVAVLRCLGATGPEVFAIYSLQALVMGGLGSLIGAVIGVLVQQVFPRVFGGFLPVDIHVAVSPSAITLGIGLGLWVAIVFALLPLIGIRNVSPLRTLRRDVEPAGQSRDPWRWGMMLLLALSVVGLSAVQVRSLRDGAVFAGGIGVVLFVLWLASLGLIRAVRRWFPSRWPYLIRQGLANLYRPANQTVTVVLALGFGAFLLSTLFLVQHNLLREFRIGGTSDRPNLMFFDIQPDQRQGVEQVLRDAGFPGGAAVPVVPMRIRAINGKPIKVEVPSPDSENTGRRGRRGPGDRSWAVRREYRSTYRDTLVASEKLVAGKWWETPRQPTSGTGSAAPSAPFSVSLETGIATELGVTIGDLIDWDVQGTVVSSRVANLREVNWGRFETNFFVVFSSGALEKAPQMLVTLARVEDATQRGGVQRRMAERFPNVTAIDLSQIQQALEAVLSKAALAVRFMALFSLATGAIVLVGAVATSRFQRIREGVLLKTIGATRAQVLTVIIAEYVALGSLSALAAIVLASGAGWALAKWVFESPFAVPVGAMSALAAGMVALTLAVGLWNSTEVLNRTPLEVLRND